MKDAQPDLVQQDDVRNFKATDTGRKYAAQAAGWDLVPLPGAAQHLSAVAVEITVWATLQCSYTCTCAVDEDHDVAGGR